METPQHWNFPFSENMRGYQNKLKHQHHIREKDYSFLLSSRLLYIPQCFCIEEVFLQLICIVLLFFQYVINRSCISSEKQPQLNVKLINLTFKEQGRTPV